MTQFTEISIFKIRSNFQARSEKDKKLMILQKWEEGRKNGLQYVTNLLVGGIKVCVKAFLAIYGVSRNKLYKPMKQIARRPRALQPESKKIVAWLHNCFDRIGDLDPVTRHTVLPIYFEKNWLHRMYMQDTNQLKSQKTFVNKYRTFCLIIRKHFSDVRWPKTCKLGKCTTCIGLKGQTSRATMASNVANQQLLNDHHEFIIKERAAYTKHKKKASAYPSKYLSLIIDGTAGIPFPWINPLPKSYLGKKFWTYNITGVLNHSHNHLRYYTSGKQFQKTANFIPSILWHYISTLKTIPPTLYLQVDNCWAENKNKYVLCS